MTLRIRLYGDRLDDLAKSAVVEVVDRALDAGVESAKRLVPVDTGHLQSRIEVQERAHEEGDGVVGSYGVTDVEYAEHVEFGTANGPEQPYMRPSIDAMKQVLR